MGDDFGEDLHVILSEGFGCCGSRRTAWRVPVREAVLVSTQVAVPHAGLT